MYLKYLKNMEKNIDAWLKERSTQVDHKAIRKDIFQETSISSGYIIMLLLANLIALSGLIINSAPVIIGAMLISPLMGPILSSGYAFITGDTQIWRLSIKKLIISVLLTIVVAALASVVSPLDDITNEIRARTIPNLYDLVIAFLSGMAGAAALCTKKNYLTIVPGVAIATAVIPPLSVAGFGLGTGRLLISSGAFLLFFTNFVAILISSCIVFFIYGFRPSLVDNADVVGLKKRIFIMLSVLCLISIPLAHTLATTISDVRLKRDIQQVLRQHLDKPRITHLVSFNYDRGEKVPLNISAVVNTVKFLEDNDIIAMEKAVRERIKKDVALNVEQIRVHPMKLDEQTEAALVPALKAPDPPKEIVRKSRDELISLIRHVSRQIDDMMAPSAIVGFNAGFDNASQVMSLHLKIRKDVPLIPEERLWIERHYTVALDTPVSLTVETVPFMQPLVFSEKQIEVTAEMRRRLEIAGDAFRRNPKTRFVILSIPEASLPYSRRMILAKERAEAITHIMATEYAVPRIQMHMEIGKKALRTPLVQVSVSAVQEDAGRR